MASINISIKKEAYEFLKKMKTEDMSFSDVILRFRKKQDSVNNFFGVLKDFDWNKKESNMKDLRNSFNAKLQ